MEGDVKEARLGETVCEAVGEDASFGPPAGAPDEREAFNLEGEFHEDGLDSVAGVLKGGLRARAGDSEERDVDDAAGEEGDGLEFEYEPGISLSNLEFGQDRLRRTSAASAPSLAGPTEGAPGSASVESAAALLEVETCWPENCLFCGIDYETGESFISSPFFPVVGL